MPLQLPPVVDDRLGLRLRPDRISTAGVRRRDVDLLLALRNEKRITGTFRIDHAPGRSTPLLAIADITAVAVMASYAGEGSFREILRDKLTVIEI